MIDAKPDWSRVDTVLLDMDGTVLDLAFDHYFWAELVPRRYALARGITLEESLAILVPKFRAIEHTLPWYSTRYWSEVTGLDLYALKREIRERVSFIGNSLPFLEAVRASGRRLWLATNAHHESWSVKLEQLGLTSMFEVIISSHDFDVPKEDPRFWPRVQQRHPFDPARAFFADDSLPVLRAARDHGIAELVAMRRPASTLPVRLITEFASVDGLGDLLPL